MKAAVLRAIGEPLRIEDVTLDAPKLREVVVRIAAVGVCHSDLHVLEGSLPNPLPMVLGHEPAGIVERVGSEVRHVAVGDHVIGCLSMFCGTCEYCMGGRPYLCEDEATRRRADEPPRLANGAEAIGQFANLGAFAERILVHENALVRIRPDVALDRAALIGCGVTTGLGAVFNRARVRAGQSVVVIGCGGIGLSVVQGCRIAGAGKIIAVDTVPWKLDLATRLGATGVVNAGEGNPVPPIVAMTAGGVDVAFEAIGNAKTSDQIIQATRPGGTATIIGGLGSGPFTISSGSFVTNEIAIKGVSSRRANDVVEVLQMVQDGRIDVKSLITKKYGHEQINEALEDLEHGKLLMGISMWN